MNAPPKNQFSGGFDVLAHQRDFERRVAELTAALEAETEDERWERFARIDRKRLDHRQSASVSLGDSYENATAADCDDAWGL